MRIRVKINYVNSHFGIKRVDFYKLYTRFTNLKKLGLSLPQFFFCPQQCLEVSYCNSLGGSPYLWGNKVSLTNQISKLITVIIHSISISGIPQLQKKEYRTNNFIVYSILLNPTVFYKLNFLKTFQTQIRVQLQNKSLFFN